FRFEERLRLLETSFSEYRQTNQFADAVSAILGIVHQYMDQQMKEAVREAVQIQTDRLQDSLQRGNDEFFCNINENINKRSDEQRNLYKALVEAYEADKAILDTYGDSTILKRRQEDDDQEGPFAGPNRGSKRQKEGGEQASASTPSEKATKGAGGSTTGSQSRQRSASESAYAEEPVQTTCQIEETPHLVFETALPAAQGDAQSWISNLARQTDARSSFNELLDTPIDFSNFIMLQLNVDTLTPDLLAGPTYELMRGSCTSLTELEYHLEEVYKATTDQLDWVNPEGQQYPHNLLQPLLLIPDNLGRRVIMFEHFINNDLEYLRGGASSHKYTTSVTKTKAADYGHIKWIEDLVPREMWIQQPIDYNKHALWGVSHWGRKRKQLYGYAVNRESARDVYSKRRIITIYKFKEGDFKRLRLQDIEDMLLLLEELVHQRLRKTLTYVLELSSCIYLDDRAREGTDCLPNEEIFTELARMGYEKPSTKLTFYKAIFSSQWKFLIHTILQCMCAKRTSWNEFSSYMASAVICLSTGRKFNFSKAQVGDLSSHSTKYSSPALTQKVFTNMRRVGKGCSRVETPLFEGMIVAQQVGEGATEVNVDNVPAAGVADEGAAKVNDDNVPAAVDEPSIPSPTPPTQPPLPLQDQPSTSQVQPPPP
nr:hypothetical protein [Tanacetum cinerariifolium]